MLFDIHTLLSSVLLEEGEVYARTACSLPVYHFAAIEIKVKTSDYYKIASNATFDPLGYIYEELFDPFNPMKNLREDFYQETCDHQFKMTVNLRANSKYVLVVTTYSPFQNGAFSITVTGLHNVSLIRLSE